MCCAVYSIQSDARARLDQTRNATANTIPDAGNNEQASTSSASSNTMEPSLKRFRYLARTLESDSIAAAHNYISSSENDMAKYMYIIRDSNAIGFSAKPLEFWLDNVNQFPHISKLALDLCAAPASEAYCERIFSLCGDLCARKRNRAKRSLEMKVFLKINKKLLTA